MPFMLRFCLFTLAAGSLAQAQVPRGVTTHFVSDGFGAELSGISGPTNYSIIFTQTDAKGKEHADGGWLSFHACRPVPPTQAGWPGMECFYGSGPIPASYITHKKSPEPSITLAIPDVAKLPAPFAVDGSTCGAWCEYTPLPSPFPVQITVRPDGLSETDEDISSTSRHQLGDGSMVIYSWRGKRTIQTASPVGVLGLVAVSPFGTNYMTQSRNMSHSLLRTRGK